jgi:hypothetical protein
MTILWSLERKHPGQISAYETQSWLSSAVPAGLDLDTGFSHIPSAEYGVHAFLRGRDLSP